MRRRLALAAASLCLLAGVVAVSGCGQEEHTDVVEGQPLEIGELRYNVAITRFLNPNDVEDEGYLVGQSEPPRGKSYLGVFLTVENESDETAFPSAHRYAVSDTDDNEYEPVESKSAFALDVGSNVPAEGELPIDDSIAATGVIEGAMLLFLVDDFVSESRPLELEIQSYLGTGYVELDI